MSIMTEPSDSTKTMLVAIINGPKQLKLDRTPLPDPGPQQVRIKLEGCGVCASDLPIWEGREWFTYPFAPGAPGHEGWGHLDAIDSQVNGFQIGDRVAFLSNHAYAEYAVTNAKQVLKLPEDIQCLPFPGEPLGCAMNIYRRSDIRSGQTIAIVGIGFIGALLTKLASHAGARVIAISRRNFALDIARRFGAYEFLNSLDTKLVIEKIMQLTRGNGCDRVIEAVGMQESLDLATELTKERGKLVIAGYHQDGSRKVNMQLWNWRGLDVINAHERDSQLYLEGMRAAADMVASHALNPASLYTHRFRLDQLDRAFELLRQRPDGFLKALVIP